LFYYQNALQTPTPNAQFTRHLYSVHAARFQRVRACSKETPPHGVLGDCMERLHSVAGVLHILNAVGTLLGRHSGVSGALRRTN